MICTTAINTSNTIRTQTGTAVSLIERSGYYRPSTTISDVNSSIYRDVYRTIIGRRL